MLLNIGGEDSSAMLADLERAGVQLNPYALTYLTDKAFMPLKEMHALKIRICTVAELGLAQGASLMTVFAAAKSQGLALCPAETAVYLRLAMRSQSPSRNRCLTGTHTVPDGAVTVASEPLHAADDFPKGLYLRNVGGVLWLRGYTCTEEYLWSGDSRLAFMVPPTKCIRRNK